MSACPNFSHPDYRAAVEAYGEDQAFQMFIDNNFEMPKIQSRDNSVGYEFGKTIFPNHATQQLINQRPDVAKKIIDSLKKLMPDVVIREGGIVDENGKTVKIAPGEKGMHYRNAFVSQVAWANDGFLETPPHEYAHHYIEMYLNSPIIQEGIKRNGSIEALATAMGRYYAGNKMSSGFENWVKRFWNYVKALVGSPDINDIIGEAFLENKKLSQEEEGLATVNYQKANVVRVRHKTGIDTSQFSKSVIDTFSLPDAAKKFLQALGVKKDVEAGDWKDVSFRLINKIDEFVRQSTTLIAGQTIYKDHISSKYLNDLKKWIQEEVNAKTLMAAIKQKPISPDLYLDNRKTKSIKSKQDRDAVIDEIKNNKNFIVGVTEDGTEVAIDSGIEYKFYRNTRTDKDYQRMTTLISDDGSPDTTDPIIASALKIGSKVDALTRDFFAGKLKPFAQYDLGDDAMINAFIDELKVVKDNMDKRGEEVLANDIILYDDAAGIAGTVDLLTYDSDGNFRIYDMKTMRGNQFSTDPKDVHQSGDNKGKTKYDHPYKFGKSSNREKHQKQLSGYRIMLHNTHGILAKTIAVLPIQVQYKGGETKTTVLHKLKGVEHTPLDQVSDPTKIELIEEGLPTDTTPDGKMKYSDLIGQMYNAMNYTKSMQDKLAMEDDKVTGLEDAVDIMRTEIDNAIKRKNQVYDKIKYLPLKKALRYIEKIMKYLINPRLNAKYISGSEDSTLYKFAYKALNHAENMRNYFLIEFNAKLMEDSFADDYKNWSYFKNKKKNISELSTETFQGLDVNGKIVDVQLTKAEMMSVYLMNRQDRAKIPMLEKGVILHDVIEGRDLPVNKPIIFDKVIIDVIVSKIANDKDLMKVVSNIDNALNFMKPKVQEAFLKENGIELRMEANYFPVSAGSRSREMRKGKSAVNDWRSLHTSLDENKPIRLIDPIEAINSYKVNAASYAALTAPIQNMRKILKAVKDDYMGTPEQHYFESIEETLNLLEDRSMLYSGQGEEDWAKGVNKLTNNFAVAVLGMNVPVMLKQTVSYITAMEVIDSKYLKMAGFGSKVYPIMNPKGIFEALKFSKLNEGKSILPIEWNLDTTVGNYALMRKYSPALTARLDGFISRELGEALMNQDTNDDLITIPWMQKNGKPVQISKTRMMEGIRVFDMVGTENLWRALEFEAEAETNLKRGTDEFYTHVAIRLEEVIARTQSNFNLTDRANLSSSQNNVARFFTMFSSSSSKVAMLQIDGIIDYLQNPTPEQKKKLLKRSANIIVTTGMTIAAIDMLKSMLIYGWDDDDEENLLKNSALAMTVNGFGNFYGLGQVARVVGSQLDDKPFYQTLQDPIQLLTQDVSMAIANLAKGNIDDAVLKGIETTLKATGAPLNPYITAKGIIKRNLEE